MSFKLKSRLSITCQKYSPYLVRPIRRGWKNQLWKFVHKINNQNHMEQINNMITFFAIPSFLHRKFITSNDYWSKKKHFPILKISHCSLTHGNVLFYSSFLSTTLGRIGYGINNFQPTCYRFYLAGIIQTRASTTPYTKHVQTSNATVCEKNEALTGPPTHP